MFKRKDQKSDIEVVEFEQEGVRFSIPKRISVHQQQIYAGAATYFDSADWVAKRWEAAKTLIIDWECELLPELNTDLNTVYDVGILDITQWVGLKVMAYMNSLENTAKN
jgi:hypothetical protein